MKSSVEIKFGQKGNLELFAYDSIGGQVSHSNTEFRLPATMQELETMSISWVGSNGSDYVPTGHYFLFWTITDSLGASLHKDSTCYGWVYSGK